MFEAAMQDDQVQNTRARRQGARMPAKETGCALPTPSFQCAYSRQTSSKQTKAANRDRSAPPRQQRLPSSLRFPSLPSLLIVPASRLESTSDAAAAAQSCFARTISDQRVGATRPTPASLLLPSASSRLLLACPPASSAPRHLGLLEKNVLPDYRVVLHERKLVLDGRRVLGRHVHVAAEEGKEREGRGDESARRASRKPEEPNAPAELTRCWPS